MITEKATYEGQFKNNQKNGYGTFFTDDYRYEGFFKDDEFDGEGTVTKKDGTKIVGFWEDGKLVKRPNLSSKN